MILSCSKTDSLSNSESSSDPKSTDLRIFPGASSANINKNGYVVFNPFAVQADGGNPLSHYTWSLDPSSNPPLGLTINSFSGVINILSHSNTGLQKGYSSFKVIVRDGNSTATGTITLYVSITTDTFTTLIPLSQILESQTLVNGKANKAYAATLLAMGGVPPYKWQLDQTYSGSSDLTNAGLTVDNANGLVRGTVLNSAAGKTIKFKVKLTDATGKTSPKQALYSIKID